MRRLDCVLESKKDEVYNLYQKFKDQFDDPDLRKIVIERFMELAKVKFK